MSGENLSLQDLLKFVGEAPEKEPSPVEILSQGSKISDYINKYQLKKGVDRVKSYVIYYHYKEMWGGDLSKIEFFRQFRKEGFVQKRTGKQKFYLIEVSCLQMSREDFIEADYNKEQQ